MRDTPDERKKRRVFSSMEGAKVVADTEAWKRKSKTATEGNYSARDTGAKALARSRYIYVLKEAVKPFRQKALRKKFAKNPSFKDTHEV